ncbi:MAG: hypothetical protein AAGJ29_12115, partial [Pseudomonadota bacterium]
KRITANLLEENAAYVEGIAKGRGKTLAWAIERIIEEHKEGSYRARKPGQPPKRRLADYDEESPHVKKLERKRPY